MNESKALDSTARLPDARAAVSLRMNSNMFAMKLPKAASSAFFILLKKTSKVLTIGFMKKGKRKN